MSPILLLVAMAFAEGNEDQFGRLFTAAGETAEAAAAEPGAVPSGGWAWPALLSGGGLLAAWQLRKRTINGAPAGMRVVQRQSLGDKSTLVLVEVPDASGATRRLLLGSANGSLSLLNDLGIAGEAPAATPAKSTVATVAEVTMPREEDEEVVATARPLAPVAEFAQLLGDVLQERQPVVEPTSTMETPRYFNLDDLAPEPERTTDELLREFSEAPATPPVRRPRFTSRKATPTSAAVVTATPAPLRELPAAAPTLPRLLEEEAVTPIAARIVVLTPVLSPAPVAEAAPRRNALSALVKETLPDASAARRTVKGAATKVETAPEAVAAPALTVAPPLEAPPVLEVAAPVVAPPARTLAQPAVAFAPSPLFSRPVALTPASPPVAATRPLVATQPAAAARPTPARPMFTSPSLGGPVPTAPAAPAARRFVGPALRDPSLVAPSTGPRLRLADEHLAAAEVPSTQELLARLQNAQAEPERAVVNGSGPTRADGLKRRFEAITAASGAR